MSLSPGRRRQGEEGGVGGGGGRIGLMVGLLHRRRVVLGLSGCGASCLFFF